MLTRLGLRGLRHRVRAAAGDERGQIAWGFVLLLLVVFMFFAFAFDAGMWFFDHRTAQNQAEAAALAAVQELPATDTTAAEAAAEAWLGRNGASSAADGCTDRPWIEFQDVNSDGKDDRVTVCLRRSSGIVFAALSQITDAKVSAAATALTGPASIANVMPWAVVPPDPDCVQGQVCQGDANGDGDFTDPGDCVGDFDDCPWGLNKDNLYAFKSGGGGNTGIIDACGQGAVNYRDCIEGETISGFYQEGDNVNVGLQGGNLGVNTDNALTERYAEEAAAGGWPCDVAATPDVETGYDPDGKLIALDRFDTNPPQEYCRERLVLIPILYSMPPQGGGSASLQVLGVATFGIASWNRNTNQDAFGTPASECSTTNGAGFPCGLVWGYLMEGLRPPDFLLQKISDTDNPFAPLLIALVE